MVLLLKKLNIWHLLRDLMVKNKELLQRLEK